MAAEMNWVNAGDETGTARRANTGVGKGVVVTDGLLREPVQVGRGAVSVAVETKVRAGILAGDPKNVRAGRGLARLC